MKSHKYIRKENKNGKVRYIYTERDIRENAQMDKSFLAAKQEGSFLAGPRYEKAIEFFIRGRSSQTNGRADSKNIEREEFIKYCKDNGLWKDEMKEISPSHFLGNGVETNVYSYGKDEVLKQMTLSQHEHLDSPIEDILERIANYNAVFPDSYLKLEGFGEFEFEGEKQFSVLTTQTFIKGVRGVDRDEVKKFMEKKGFKHDKGNTYYNSHFIVDDLHNANILKNENGYFVIDCFVERNDEQGWKKIEGEI